MNKVLWCMVVVVLVIMSVGICDISSLVKDKYEESKLVSNSEMAVFSETAKDELIISANNSECKKQIIKSRDTIDCPNIANIYFNKLIIINPTKKIVSITE